MALDKTLATNLKKLIHNGIERNRKQKIFGLIDDIINLLPFKYEYKNKSKSKKLERIQSYVIELKNKNDALMFANPETVLAQEIIQLRKRIEDLEKMIQAYCELLKSAGISPDKFLLDPTIPDQWKKRPLKYSTKANKSKTSDNTSESDFDEDSENDINQNAKKLKLNCERNAQTNILLTNSSTSSYITNLSTGINSQQFILLTGATGTSAHYLALPVNMKSTNLTGAPGINNLNVPLQIVNSIDNSNNEPDKKSNIRKSNKKTKQTKTKVSKVSQEEGKIVIEPKNNSSPKPVSSKDLKSPLTTTIIEQSNENDEADEIIFLEQFKKQSEECSSSSKLDDQNKISEPKEKEESPKAIPNQTDDKKSKDESKIQSPEIQQQKKKLIEEQSSTEENSKRSDEQEQAMLPSSDSISTEITSISNKNNSSFYYTANLFLQSDQLNKSSNDNKTAKFLPNPSEPPASLFRFGSGSKPNDQSVSNEDSQQKKRSLYHNFEIDYHSIYADISTTPNHSVDPQQIMPTMSANSSSKSFEMPSFGNTNSNPISNNQTGTTNSNSSFGHHHSYQPTVSDSYSNHPNQPNAAPFPPPFPPISFDSNVFTSQSPHKSSSNHPNHHQFNNLIDFNANFQPTNIGSTTTTENIEVNSRYSTNRSSSNNKSTSSITSRNKKSNSNTNQNSNAKSQRSSTTTTKSSANGSKKSDQNQTASSSSSSSSNLKRNSNENQNYFMIPDIISTSNNQQQNYSSPQAPQSGEQQLFNQNNHRYPNFFGTYPDHQQANNQCSDSPSESESQPEISSCYPILFRPHNSSSLTNNSTTSNSLPTISTTVTLSSSTSYLRPNYSHNHHYNQHHHQNQQQQQHNTNHNNHNVSSHHQTSGSLYYPSSTSGDKHIPNFNLSNIFPDITSSSSSTVAPPPPPPAVSLNSYPSYIPSSTPGGIVDLNPPVNGSTSGSTKFNSTNALRSQHTSNNGNGFLTKFSHILPSSISSITTKSSSSSSSSTSVVSVDALTTSLDHPSSSNSKSYYQNHSNQNHSNYQHFYSTQHPNFVSNNTVPNSGSSTNIPMSRRLSTSTSSSSSLTTTTTTTASINDNEAMNRSNYLMPPPPPPPSSSDNHSNNHTQSLQSSFGFPYPPPPMVHHQSGPNGELTSISTNINHHHHQHGHHSHPHSQTHHHSYTSPSSSTTATLGSFARSSTVNANAPPPPPHHISFPLFNLSRSDL